MLFLRNKCYVILSSFGGGFVVDYVFFGDDEVELEHACCPEFY